MFKKVSIATIFLGFVLPSSFAMKFDFFKFIGLKKINRTQSDLLPISETEKNLLEEKQNALKKMKKYFYDCRGGVEYSAGSKDVVLISSGAVGMNSFGGSKVVPGITEINSFKKKSLLKDFCSNVHSKTMGLYMISWPKKQEWQEANESSVENLIDYLKLFKEAGATVVGVMLDVSMFQSCAFCKKRMVYNNQKNEKHEFIFTGINENEKLFNDPKNKRKSLGFLFKPCSLQNFTQMLEKRLKEEDISVPIFVSSDEVMKSILKFV